MGFPVEPPVGSPINGPRFATSNATEFTGFPSCMPPSCTMTRFPITSGVDPVKPDGERLARASMPGWSQRRFDELADQVGRRAAGSPVLELEPWAQSRLPLYLAGWLSSEDVCSTAKGLRRGDLAAVNLPRGLLLTLYADDAVLSPRLPASLQEDAAAIVGQAPVEVFLTERNEDGPISSGRLLRDGSQCERESAGP